MKLLLLISVVILWSCGGGHEEESDPLWVQAYDECELKGGKASLYRYEDFDTGETSISVGCVLNDYPVVEQEDPQWVLAYDNCMASGGEVKMGQCENLETGEYDIAVQCIHIHYTIDTNPCETATNPPQ